MGKIIFDASQKPQILILNLQSSRKQSRRSFSPTNIVVIYRALGHFVKAVLRLSFSMELVI